MLCSRCCSGGGRGGVVEVDGTDAQHRDRLPVAIGAAVGLPLALLEHDHLLAKRLLLDGRQHAGVLEPRRADGREGARADQQHLVERDGLPDRRSLELLGDDHISRRDFVLLTTHEHHGKRLVGSWSVVVAAVARAR